MNGERCFDLIQQFDLVVAPTQSKKGKVWTVYPVLDPYGHHSVNADLSAAIEGCVSKVTAPHVAQ